MTGLRRVATGGVIIWRGLLRFERWAWLTPTRHPGVRLLVILLAHWLPVAVILTVTGVASS